PRLAEFDWTPKDIVVLDLCAWLLMNETRANRIDGVARQIAAHAHHGRGKELRILPETTQRRIARPKSKRDAPVLALDLELTAFACDLVEPFHVKHGVDQRR